MKSEALLILAFFTLFTLGVQTAAAQSSITLPKIPTIQKANPKPRTPPSPANESATNVANLPTESKSNDGSKAEKETKRQEQDTQYYTFGAYKLYLADLEATVKSAEEYTPESDRAPYTYRERYDWGLLAVSASARNESILGSEEPEFAAWRKANPKNRWDTALAKLASLLAKHLPAFKGSLDSYKFRSPADERIMKTVLNDISRYQIFAAGTKQSGWLIEKNDYGIPVARYKHGVLYLKDKKGDHPYCYLTFVNVIQDYAGGGTYSPSRGRFIEDQLVGCPAGNNSQLGKAAGPTDQKPRRLK